jgi:hypothetical protein
LIACCCPWDDVKPEAWARGFLTLLGSECMHTIFGSDPNWIHMRVTCGCMGCS